MKHTIDQINNSLDLKVMDKHVSFLNGIFYLLLGPHILQHNHFLLHCFNCTIGSVVL